MWTTHARRTDAPDGPLGSTRITQAELAARNRRARFPAAPCGGVLRIASAGDPAHPLFGPRVTKWLYSIMPKAARRVSLESPAITVTAST